MINLFYLGGKGRRRTVAGAGAAAAAAAAAIEQSVITAADTGRNGPSDTPEICFFTGPFDSSTPSASGYTASATASAFPPPLGVKATSCYEYCLFWTLPATEPPRPDSPAGRE